MCLYTRRKGEIPRNECFALRRVTPEFVYYDEFINPVLYTIIYIYIASVNSNRSLFQSLVQHSLSRKLYRIAEYIFVVGKRLNDGWKINSEVVLVRKPSSFLFLKKLVPFIYRNNRIFTNHGFVMHVQNPGIGKLIDQTLEICTYIYIYIYLCKIVNGGARDSWEEESMRNAGVGCRSRQRVYRLPSRQD